MSVFDYCFIVTALRFIFQAWGVLLVGYAIHHLRRSSRGPLERFVGIQPLHYAQDCLCCFVEIFPSVPRCSLASRQPSTIYYITCLFVLVTCRCVPGDVVHFMFHTFPAEVKARRDERRKIESRKFSRDSTCIVTLQTCGE